MWSFIENHSAFLCLFFSLDETLGDYYYFNFETGETQWSHPLDKIYCEKVIEIRTNSSKQEDISNEKIKQIRKQKNFDDKPSLAEETKNCSNSDQIHVELDRGDNPSDQKEISCVTKEQQEPQMNLTPKKLVSRNVEFTQQRNDN